MWFKILQLIQFILSLILETEGQFPDGEGSEKRAAVMKSGAAELRKEGMLGDTIDPKHDQVLEVLGNVVDGLVGLLNATGAFSHRAKAEPAPEAEPAPGAPGTA